MSINSKSITIDPNGDLIVKVVEYNHKLEPSDGQYLVLNTTYMKVSRAVLQRSSATFKAMLDVKGPWIEGGQYEVTLEDDTVTSMELWLRQLHESMNPEMYEIPIGEVWHVIEVSRKYLFELKMLNTWYAKWWEIQRKELDPESLRELLFPSHEFDCATAFAYATKELAYNWAGHITEINPTHHRHLHLRPLIIQQLNAARGSLRVTLHKGLFEPIKTFLDATCSCKEKALFAYCRSLHLTKVWPLEEHAMHNSIRSLLGGLKGFHYEPPKDGCLKCCTDKDYSVKDTSNKVAKTFGGLCLDCMDNSKPKTGDVDTDYWRHDRLRTWDSKCRISHAQPTWYFSFMGRKEAMDAHKRRQRGE